MKQMRVPRIVECKRVIGDTRRAKVVRLRTNGDYQRIVFKASLRKDLFPSIVGHRVDEDLFLAAIKPSQCAE